jgi:Crp-like helix-turn-helix domain
LGARSTIARAVVQLSGTAAWISGAQFHAAANQSEALRDLIVRYNDMLLAQVQQSVACNPLHALEARVCRWLLQTRDCIDGDAIPVTQEFLGQMLGVRRTTVTIAARVLQSAGLIRYRRGHIQIVIVRRSRRSPASAMASSSTTVTRLSRPRRQGDRIAVCCLLRCMSRLWHIGDINKIEDGLPCFGSKQSYSDGSLRVLPYEKSNAGGNRARRR